MNLIHVNSKPTVDNRWWAETSTKRPKTVPSHDFEVQAPVAASFYAIAKDYNQEQAKEHLTDSNLRLARQVEPPFGGLAYVAMTQERSSEGVLKQIRRELVLPQQVRGIIADYGRVVRVLLYGPQLEDWMIDVRLATEPSADVYVWGTLFRERVFQRPRDALRQAQRWMSSLVNHPPPRHDVLRGDLL